MHRAALVPLAVLALAAAAPARAEIASAEACEAAVAADPQAAREDASLWRRLGGGVAAELCEAEALEAMGATGSAALMLTQLAEDPKRALAPQLRLAVYEDAARLWLLDGRPDLALAALDGLDKLAPPTRTRVTLRARAAAAAQDWPQAIASLDMALADAPGDAGLLALRAAALRRSGDLAGAEAAATEALAASPDLPEALFEAGAAAAEAGEAATAEAAWLRLLAVAPDHPLSTAARRNLAALN